MTEPRTSCPSPEELGAFLEGGLTPNELTEVVAHLEACEDCRAVVGEVARFHREEPEVTRRDRLFAKWPYAAAATLILALGLGARFLAMRDPLLQVARAAADARVRPVVARLAGFAYSPPPEVERGPQTESAAALRLRAAAAEVAEDLEQSGKPADLHAAGVAVLIARRNGATDKLRAAAAGSPDEPRYWSDLAAALYTRAATEENPQELAEALAAADRALRLDPAQTDALFNRALILEALGLGQHAAAAWNAYLRVDAKSGWADEARKHAQALAGATKASERRKAVDILRAPHGGDETVLGPVVQTFPEDARRYAEAATLGQWARALESGKAAEAAAWLADARLIGRLLATHHGDPLVADAVAAIDRCAADVCRARLAAAHRRYDDARRAYGSGDLAGALPELRASALLFRQLQTPMTFVAECYVIACLEDQSSLLVPGELARVMRTTPERYPALRAQLFWATGTYNGRIGRNAEAFDAYRRALAMFVALGESLNVSRMQNAASGPQSLLGQAVGAWQLRAAALAGFTRAGDNFEVQRALELAGRMEAVNGRWGAASALFALATEEPFRVKPRTNVSAMLWGALAEHREGFTDAARQQLAAARRYAWSIGDPSLRATAMDDLTFAEASVMRQDDPSRAAAILDRYLLVSGQRARTFLLSDAWLERARAARTMGKQRDAERFYRQALAKVEERRQDSLAVGIVQAYFATATAAASELADVLDAGGRSAEAFGVLESARGKALRAGNDGVRPEAVRRALRGSERLVSYLLLDDRLLIFTVGPREGLRTTRVGVPAEQVRRTIEEFRAAIERGDDSASGTMAERLYGWLIAPVEGFLDGAQTLVVVPDPAMESMPFGALREPQREQWLIDRMAVVLTPGALVFAQGPRSASPAQGGVMIYGNPAFLRARFDSLQPLPGAEREAISVAARYPGATAVLGPAATASRFLRELATARMIHLGAHAIASRHEPMRSMLLLAPDETVPTGVVYATDVASRACHAQMVVLAGCRTAAPAEARADIRSLGVAFLAAGARNVVGTLWNVDDGDAEAFSQRLHAALLDGVVPAEAVRRAQCDLLRTRPLRAWSAFTLTGSGI